MDEISPAARLDRLIGSTRAASVGKSCGIANSNLTRYRYGERKISTRDADRLARYFEIPVECLTGTLRKGMEALASHARGALPKDRFKWLLNHSEQIFGLTPSEWARMTGISEKDMVLFFRGEMPVHPLVLECMLKPMGVEVEALNEMHTDGEYAQAIAHARRLGISPRQLYEIILRVLESD